MHPYASRLSESLSLYPDLLDLKRGYEAPFLERAGRLPLGQASKREEAGLSVTSYPQNGAPLPESAEEVEADEGRERGGGRGIAGRDLRA